MNEVGAADTQRGILGVSVFDCLGALAPAVHVSISADDAGARALYSLKFDPTATVTDGDGIVTFVNVPPGSVTVTATPLEIGQPSTVVSVVVQANTLTEVLMFPTP